MSDNLAIGLYDIGKMYKVFPNRVDGLWDSLGLTRWISRKRVNYFEFWALRDINLELPVGRRIGIIGRNGAGKSTLLKLITGNLSPTEGRIIVHGQIQALLEMGAGFHPDFTGSENIRSSLIYQGLSREEIEAAIEDIAAFTELGPFLDRPFKTYSSGMQARLTFATATAIKPNILIIDEVLGAGDSYFFSKSQERMSGLVEQSGASVLIVSHALDQITRFCDEAVWIERGKIMRRGSAMEIVDLYERFIRLLDDRRLKARNRKIQSGRYHHDQYDQYGDSFNLSFELAGEADAFCEISRIELLKNGLVDESLSVGDVQDANPYDTARVVLEGGAWSEPFRKDGNCYRGLSAKGSYGSPVVGPVAFHTYGFYEGRYSLRILYRTGNRGSLNLTVLRQDDILLDHEPLLPTDDLWSDCMIDLPDILSQSDTAEEDMVDGATSQMLGDVDSQKTPPREVIRWPSEGSLTIQKVGILGIDGNEKAVFRVADTLIVQMQIKAMRDGQFDFIPTVTLYRLDGVFISNFIGPAYPLAVRKGDISRFELHMKPLNLGDAHYVFSVAIFDKAVSDETRLDLISRAYEFQVVGNDPLAASAVFQHAGFWSAVMDSNCNMETPNIT